MKEPKYLRKGNQTLELETGNVEAHKSINKAKQFSRFFQMKQDGNLGLGSVRVVDKFPAR